MFLEMLNVYIYILICTMGDIDVYVRHGGSVSQQG